MPEEKNAGCARPTGGPVGASEQDPEKQESNPEKEIRKMINLGKPAPDFVAPAYHKGKFTSVKLSDYLGKWLVLCLYPGDFTFV